MNFILMIINHLDLNGNKMSNFEFDITPKIIEAKEGKTLNKPFRTPKGPKSFLFTSRTKR